MPSLKKLILGSPIESGAQLVSAEELAEVARAPAAQEAQDINPFAKVVGHLLETYCQETAAKYPERRRERLKAAAAAD